MQSNVTCIFSQSNLCGGNSIHLKNIVSIQISVSIGFILQGWAHPMGIAFCSLSLNAVKTQLALIITRLDRQMFYSFLNIWTCKVYLHEQFSFSALIIIPTQALATWYTQTNPQKYRMHNSLPGIKGVFTFQKLHIINSVEVQQKQKKCNGSISCLWASLSFPFTDL